MILNLTVIERPSVRLQRVRTSVDEYQKAYLAICQVRSWAARVSATGAPLQHL